MRPTPLAPGLDRLHRPTDEVRPGAWTGQFRLWRELFFGRSLNRGCHCGCIRHWAQDRRGGRSHDGPVSAGGLLGHRVGEPVGVGAGFNYGALEGEPGRRRWVRVTTRCSTISSCTEIAIGPDPPGGVPFRGHATCFDRDDIRADRPDVWGCRDPSKGSKKTELIGSLASVLQLSSDWVGVRDGLI